MKLKKLLALMLALMMAVCVFAACDEKASNDKDDKEENTQTSTNNEKKVSDEDAIKNLTEDYVKYYLKGDEKAKEYVVAEEREELDVKEFDKMKERFAQSIDDFSDGAPDEIIQYLEAWKTNYLKEVDDSLAVEVQNIKVNGEAASSTTVVSFLSLEEIDGNAIFEGMNEQLKGEDLSAMSTAEYNNALLGACKVEFEKLESEAKENLEKMTENVKYKKIDGTWFVSFE